MKSYAWLWRRLKEEHRAALEASQGVLCNLAADTVEEVAVAYCRSQGRFQASQNLQSIIEALEAEAREEGRIVEDEE